MTDSFNPSVKLAELLILKRDFDLITKLTRSSGDETRAYMMPYCALLCYEAITYYNKNIRRVDISQTSQYSIKEIRQKAKFFDLKVKKLLQGVENIDKL